MGQSCSLVQRHCRQECHSDKNCYIDQNEMKFGPASPDHGRDGNRTIPKSSRSTAATSSCSLWPGKRLSPESVTWTDGLGRRVVPGRWQLTPKASSFAGGALPPTPLQALHKRPF
ncbi:unnamed protein product [Symbiodinium natans]|uniref:Uncharacterized protein n=1 Tax=Symbiodinium natans TaxID=878477 RepID=A0A812SX33_9DINO|nr:unnamed protein product [Symbiodinium natans]